MTCELRNLFDTGCQYRADGQPDRFHWIPKQRLRQVFEARGVDPEQIDYLLYDPRVWDLGCRLHHGQLDGPWFRLSYGQVPKKVKDYAKEHSFFWAGEERGFVGGYVPKDRAAA